MVGPGKSFACSGPGPLTLRSVNGRQCADGQKQSVFDFKMWFLVFLNIGLSAAYGFSNFFPSIVRNFNYPRTTTLLMTAPPYIFAAILSLINAWHSDKTRERGYHFSIPIACGCVGYIICLATTNNGARYGASFIYVGGMYASSEYEPAKPYKQCVG